MSKREALPLHSLRTVQKDEGLIPPDKVRTRHAFAQRKDGYRYIGWALDHREEIVHGLVEPEPKLMTRRASGRNCLPQVGSLRQRSAPSGGLEGEELVDDRRELRHCGVPLLGTSLIAEQRRRMDLIA